MRSLSFLIPNPIKHHTLLPTKHPANLEHMMIQSISTIQMMTMAKHQANVTHKSPSFARQLRKQDINPPSKKYRATQC